MRAGQQLVGHDSPGVDVGAMVDHLTHRLLRRHVGRRADRAAGLGERGRGATVLGAGRGQGLGDAEIRDHRRAVRQQHVVGFDVPVDDSLAVGVGERPGHIAKDGHGLPDGERRPRDQSRPERLAGHERHDVVGNAGRLAGAQDGHDVGLLEAGHEPELAGKPLGAHALCQIAGHHLDHHVPVQRVLAGDEHPGHPAAAEFPIDAVAVRERGADLLDHELT